METNIEELKKKLYELNAIAEEASDKMIAYGKEYEIRSREMENAYNEAAKRAWEVEVALNEAEAEALKKRATELRNVANEKKTEAEALKKSAEEAETAAAKALTRLEQIKAFDDVKTSN